MDLRITTDRLVLRRPGRTDLEPYTRYCQSPRTRFVGGPFDPFQAFDKLAAMIGHWDLRGFGRLILTDRHTGRPLGHVGALQLTDAEPPELTWTLWRDDDEGQGYAAEACVAYRDLAVARFGITRPVARIHADNQRSRALALRLGGILNTDAAPPAWSAEAVSYDFDWTGQGPTFAPPAP